MNRTIGTPEWATQLDNLAGRSAKEEPEKSQVSAEIYLLQELPRHDHPLDLVGALVDLGVVSAGFR